MSTTGFKVALVLAMVAGVLPAIAQQRPPFIGPQPRDPGPNRLEVRFAMGKQPVTCKRFQLTAEAGRQTILAGSFASGFSIPPAALANHYKLDIVIKCGEHKWHFSEVSPRAFLRGSRDLPGLRGVQGCGVDQILDRRSDERFGVRRIQVLPVEAEGSETRSVLRPMNL